MKKTEKLVLVRPAPAAARASFLDKSGDLCQLNRSTRIVTFVVDSRYKD
jgi:hypothetical protein